MSDAKLYAYTAIIIFVILYLIFMCINHNKKTAMYGDNFVLVDINGKVVKMSSTAVAAELEEIKNDIERHSHHNLEFQEVIKNPNCPCHTENMEKIKSQCNKISKVLDKFILRNTVYTPYTNADIIDSTKSNELEMKILTAYNAESYLNGNLANVPLRELDGANESDQTEYVQNDGAEGFTAVGQNASGSGGFYDRLDAAIKLLRSEKCSGRVDLNNLYSLQNQLRAKLGCTKKKCKCRAARHSEWADANKFNKFIELRNADMIGGQIMPQDSYAYGSDQDPFGATRLRPGGNMIDDHAKTFNYLLNMPYANPVPYKDAEDDNILYNNPGNNIGAACGSTLDDRIMSETGLYATHNTHGDMHDCAHIDGFSAGPRADSENTDREIFFEKTSPAMAAQEANIRNKDLYPMNLSVELGLGDTWDKFIRANPEGWLHRRDIEPRDMLGYRLAGSFQHSLYTYTDPDTYKVDRCLQDKYRNLEDKNIFNECMGWK